MSLSDLKKTKGKKKKKLSVEEFINDARAYAEGKSILESAKRKKIKASNRNYKNATFTLSPDNLEKLTKLSEETGIAKSKIIRILIEKQEEIEPEQLVILSEEKSSD